METTESVALLLNNIVPKSKIVKVHLTECLGMVLGEDIVSDIMVPSFPKSAMDGYAVYSEDVKRASSDNPVELTVADELLAGDFKTIKYEKNTAIRVMTGAYVPEGYDAVIKQEDTDYGEDKVLIYTSIKPYFNYCHVGEDIKKGDIVIKKNTRFTAVHIGMLASIGREWVNVYEPVKVAIISTGSEIKDVGEVLVPGKIYNSIAYMLSAAIKKEGLVITSMHICEDEEEILKGKLINACQEADMVITTGAVSVGKKDIIPGVLEGLGADTIFKRVNIQPGTPTMASMLNGTPVLSLSGNPYAAIANFELYFWSIVAKMMHNDSFDVRIEEAVLASEYNKVNKLKRLIRANAINGKVYLPSSVHSSSVIHNLADCNCFIELEAGRKVSIGDKVTIRYIKGI